MRVDAAAYDSVVFTSLRPMDDLNRSVPVLLYDANFECVVGILFSHDCIVTDRQLLHSNDFIGWRDIPKFAPGWLS